MIYGPEVHRKLRKTKEIGVSKILFYSIVKRAQDLLLMEVQKRTRIGAELSRKWAGSGPEVILPGKHHKQLLVQYQ